MRLWLRLEVLSPLSSGTTDAQDRAETVAILAHWRPSSRMSATVDHLAQISAGQAAQIADACNRAGLSFIDNRPWRLRIAVTH